MPKPRLYLAGPEVFLPDAAAIGLRKKTLCENFGFVGLFPLDNDFAAETENIDEKIFAANLALMREAEAGIFNLTPFRGVHADPGTVFELGFFKAQNKPLFAYTNSPEHYFDRVAEKFGLLRPSDGDYCDSEGLMVENFGNADNLMLDVALKSQGREIVRPAASQQSLDDLAGFTVCLRQARQHFGF
ncbi:nucleoside 2-deoxyribosyltransferase [uncultured Rhodoblastus sp.]|uniref:nucleoside 2-deoxyribosyltransferase n=1 Tax=uncultured Rhodoblastus sp. TaxID=543037 RepID=UPI0025CC1C26|nr:nucleoside 2-deoxyribosyltransferase [uncultured Rhodoblastus sp.]